MTWDEWQKSRETKRAALRKHGCEASSRRSTSFNTAERFMRAAFGGARVPEIGREEERKVAGNEGQ